MELSLFFFFSSPLHFISARNHEFETASRETKWLQTFIYFLFFATHRADNGPASFLSLLPSRCNHLDGLMAC